MDSFISDAKVWRRFMADFGHIKTDVKWKLLNELLLLLWSSTKGFFRVKLLPLFALHGKSCGCYHLLHTIFR